MKTKKKHVNKANKKPAKSKPSFRNKSISLAPMTFDQAVECALNTKPKKHT